MDKNVLFNEIYPLLKSNYEIMVTDEKDVLIFPESEEDLKYTEGFYVKDFGRSLGLIRPRLSIRGSMSNLLEVAMLL